MNKNEIIEKIKKLLRMKRGGTISEVENALSLAQKLAQQHGLDINSIDENEPAKEPITHETKQSYRIQIECKYAALIVKGFFNVDVVLGGGITFIGTKTNITIAEYVYNFLVKRFRYEWNNRSGRIRNRQAFMSGVYQALAYKLYSLMPKSTDKEGLVLAKNKTELEKYIKDTFGKTTTSKVSPDHNASTAYRYGLYAGKQIDINPAVKSSHESKMLYGKSLN